MKSADRMVIVRMFFLSTLLNISLHVTKQVLGETYYF